MTSALDWPVWTALATGWSALAVGDARARRLHPDYGPFAAALDASAESLAALAELLPQEGGVALIEAAPVRPPGARILKQAPIVQMLFEGAAPSAADVDFELLTDADAPQMLALARLTEPGPFERRTHELAPFIGVRIDGRLAAMAGERMRLPGMAELSGVCTHPDFRGRGLARGLSRVITARIRARGETPLLHAWSSNTGAIALYEALGYRVRVELTAMFLARV